MSDQGQAGESGAAPSYHDLHVTTDTYPRTSIFDMPFGYEVTCTRVGGWGLWHDGTKVAGEYDERGLRLDVLGVVIVDSLTTSPGSGRTDTTEESA